jgi:hypothetical protein
MGIIRYEVCLGPGTSTKRDVRCNETLYTPSRPRSWEAGHVQLMCSSCAARSLESQPRIEFIRPSKENEWRLCRRFQAPLRRSGASGSNAALSCFCTTACNHLSAASQAGQIFVICRSSIFLISYLLLVNVIDLRTSKSPPKKLRCRVQAEDTEGNIQGKEGKRDKIQRNIIEAKRLRTTYRDTMGTIPLRHQMRSCVGGCPDLKLTRATGESGKESRNGQNGRGVTTVIAITGQD